MGRRGKENEREKGKKNEVGGRAEKEKATYQGINKELARRTRIVVLWRESPIMPRAANAT